MSTYTVNLHEDSEGSGYWADVAELPGCFAAADTIPELHRAISEAIVLYLEDDGESELILDTPLEAWDAAGRAGESIQVRV
jgi:predicted RNase H-like HicB family nuclease